MGRLRSWIVRFSGLINKDRRDHELADELESHLQMYVEESLRRGMSPEQARREATLKFGGLESAKEKYRDQRGVPVLESLMHDIRFGLRTLAKTPGFTAVTLITLGLGIGANTAIFRVVNAVLLRPLPYPESSRLVLVWATNSARGRTEDVASYPDFEDWKAQSQSFDALAAFTRRGMILAGAGEAQMAPALQATPGFFELLGIQPAIGRTFQPEDAEQGAPTSRYSATPYGENGSPASLRSSAARSALTKKPTPSSESCHPHSRFLPPKRSRFMFLWCATLAEATVSCKSWGGCD